MAGAKTNVPFYAKVLTRDEVGNAVAAGVFYIYIHKDTGIPVAGFEDVFIQTTAGIAAVTQLNATLQAEELNIKLYENATWTGGSAIPGLNTNRVAAAAGIDAIKETSVLSGASITDVGTLIADWDILGVDNIGGATNIVDGEITVPIVLKPNTQYILRFTNTGSNSADLQTAIQLIDRPH